MQNVFQKKEKKAEIILAYTAHIILACGAREEEREDEREIRFGVATVRVSVCGCSGVKSH